MATRTNARRPQNRASNSNTTPSSPPPAVTPARNPAAADQSHAQAPPTTPVPLSTSANVIQCPLASSPNRRSQLASFCPSPRIAAVVAVLALGVGGYYFYGQYTISWKTWQLGIWKDCQDRQGISNTSVCTYYRNISYDNIASRSLDHPAPIQANTIAVGEGGVQPDVSLLSVRCGIYIRAAIMLVDSIALLVWFSAPLLLPLYFEMKAARKAKRYLPISYGSYVELLHIASAFVMGIFVSFMATRAPGQIFSVLLLVVSPSVAMLGLWGLSCIHGKWRVYCNPACWEAPWNLPPPSFLLILLAPLVHAVLSYWLPCGTVLFVNEFSWVTSVAVLVLFLLLLLYRFDLEILLRVNNPALQNSVIEILLGRPENCFRTNRYRGTTSR